MSFGDHAVLWLHVTAAIFTIGPGTAAIMSTPRFIRRRNPVVVGYLLRTTRIYSFASLLTLIFGILLTGMTHQWSQWWISVSLTLFVVAFVLLLIVMRDQRRALHTLNAVADASAADGAAMRTIRSSVEGEVPLIDPAAGASAAAETEEDEKAGDHKKPDHKKPDQPTVTVAADVQVAAVERSRIASFGGVTALIWLVILVLMAWH
jgi:hypothetical protein